VEFGFYVLLLIINAGFFIKLLLILLFIISCGSFVLIYYKYRILNIYYKEIINFNKEFNDKNIDLKEFYNKLLIKKTNIIGLSVIFFSGFKEFIYLHRKGISDVIIVAKMVKCVMRISMIREINNLFNNIAILLFIKMIILYISIVGSILGFIIFIHTLNVDLYHNISFFFILSGCIESLCSLIIGLSLFFFINMFYIKYINTIKYILNHYKIFIDEFIMLLYHKLYN